MRFDYKSESPLHTNPTSAIGAQRENSGGMTMAQILDGKARAEFLRGKTAERVEQLKATQGLVPCLAAVLVGNDPASEVYVRNKEKACKKAGIASRVLRLSADISEADLLQQVTQLNEDPGVHGILVQLPLPSHMDPEKVVAAIHPLKDVDAFHPETLGLLIRDRSRFLPCTPAGVVDLLKAAGVALSGLDAVVIGRSLIVGRPLSLLLLRENMTVTVCHSKTRNLADVVRRADLVVAAIGRAEFVKGDWIKPGAIVVDVGMNRRADGTLCGDVDFDGASKVASWITPVPGGVGPMTIAKLLENVVEAARLQGETRSTK